MCATLIVTQPAFKRPRGKHVRHNRQGYQMTRRPWLQNEKASINILRRVGCSINQIATFLGRSTSGVWSTLKTMLKRPFTKGLRDPYGRPVDLRKLSKSARRRAAAHVWSRMNRERFHWELFILGDSEEPP